MSAGEGPPPKPSAGDDEPDGPIQRFLTAESGPLMFAREMATSMATVALVGLLLFAISGVWPPMVAVESGSMNPNMQKGDLIFVTEPGRFAPDAAHGDTGVVTHRVGEEVGYKTFNDFGTVVIYERRSGPPVIHRARFWVEDGENWYDEANKAWVEGADNCGEMDNCPAPHAGFITKGDNNAYYDQTGNIREPVKPEWLVGTARLRIPYLGWVRLGFSGAATPGPIDGGTASATTGGPATVNATASSGVEMAGSVEGVSSPGLSSDRIAAV
ncbi:S24/S26 family peptidase [Halolamina salina]|uniref:S26 family signal peptidase n=1 Tax=Halolamina salina TaxID=1220023 RepID=A0ABD6B3B6_9EURY